MLTRFRKAADSLIVRILLGLIAFSFLVAGASSFLSGNSGGNIVTFSKTDSISVEMFLTVKAKEIENIQRENNINLTEEQIVAMNLDQQIVQRLVNESMIKYLAKIYDFDLSDEEVVGFVKQMPYFKDQDGKFSLKLFKEAFRNSKKLEDEYLTSLKDDLMKTAILEVFMNSFMPPKIMTDNVVSYMAATKSFDIVTIDLNSKPAGFNPVAIEDNAVEEFYKNNKNSFVIAETRDFDYIVLDKGFFSKKTKVEEAEIKNYYDDNKNDFDNKPYAEVKKEVQAILLSSKIEELTASLVKKLEEDIAAGVNLKDLATKYAVKLLTATSVSKERLGKDEKLGLADIADNIFEMNENEVSYPIELPEQNKVIITELKKITPLINQEFAQVKDKIIKTLQEKLIAEANMTILSEVQKTYSPDKTKPDMLKSKNISVKNNQSISRADAELDSKINPKLLGLILRTGKGQATNLVQDEKKGYFAFIRNEQKNPQIEKKITDTSFQQITTTIQESVMQEIIGHLTEVNDMKVKL